MAPESLRRRSGRAPGAVSKSPSKNGSNMVAFGGSWGPPGAPLGADFRIIFVIFWGPRLGKGSGGLLDRFWDRFWLDFGSIWGGFWDDFRSIFERLSGHFFGHFGFLGAPCAKQLFGACWGPLRSLLDAFGARTRSKSLLKPASRLQWR